MAYFVPGIESSIPDLATLRAATTTLNGPTTVSFPAGGGSYWFKISAPEAGAVIAGLPDVTLMTAGSISILQGSVNWSGMTLYQVAANGDFAENSYSTTQTDQPLTATYPSSYDNEDWQQLTIAPGRSSGYLNEFYLEVTAEPESDTGVWQQQGVTLPNEGQVLITNGTIGGARAAAWGANWLSTVAIGGNGGSTGSNAYSLIAANNGASSWHGSAYTDTINSIVADPATGQFSDSAGGTASVAQLNADVQMDVANGRTTASAVETVFDQLASTRMGIFGGGYTTYVSTQNLLAPGVEAPASVSAATGAVNQALTSISVGKALIDFENSLMGILKDEITAFDTAGPEPDIEKRVNAATATLVTNVGVALSGATGSVLQATYNGFSWLQSKLGFVMGNSTPVYNAFIKTTDDTTMTTLPAGHSDRYFGTDFADWVTINANSVAYGAGGNDVLVGATAGGDILSGGNGDDTLIVGGGANILEGGAGTDTVVIPYTSSQVTITRNADGTYSVNTPTGIDRLIDDEILKLNDKTETLQYGNILDSNAFQLTASEASIYRLYGATLAREPDVAGLNYWEAALNSGESLAQITTGFINSTEFQTTYGSLDNTQFVTLLYNNVLNRAPDPTGLASWVNGLNSGVSRASVVDGFSESTEYQTNTAIAASAFATTVENGADYGSVFRLYGATLGRQPDAAGFVNWVDVLVSGKSLASITTGFINSNEFQSTYGSLNLAYPLNAHTH